MVLPAGTEGSHVGFAICTLVSTMVVLGVGLNDLGLSLAKGMLVKH